MHFKTTSSLFIAGMIVLVAPAASASTYESAATEVSAYIQEHFLIKERNIYRIAYGKPEPDHVWGAGVMFTSLAGASRYHMGSVGMMRKNFAGLDAYWDSKAPIPGYEPSPTNGNGHDKYYDDNQWLVISFLEAFELTGEKPYLDRARATNAFSLSGWDDEAGGGIWWHEGHNDDGKNTCSNAPAAVACLRLAKYSEPAEAEKLIADAKKIVEWTTNNLRSENGLYADHLKVSSGRIVGGQLTYNSALMLRAYLGLYAFTGEKDYLETAKSIGRAAEAFRNREGAYRDSIKWSHLMVEADLELYRVTGEEYLLERAKKDTSFQFLRWKKEPWPDLINNASLARQLWLMADTESQVGKAFWEKSDKVRE